jgi:hypothetical protein
MSIFYYLCAMKRPLFILLFLCAAGAAAAQAQHPWIKDCAITKEYGFMSETFRLAGNVKLITDPKEHADFNVKVVGSPGGAAMYVKKVTACPCVCGEWRFVEAIKDAYFTVRFVKEWEDFTMVFVTEYPGSRY